MPSRPPRRPRHFLVNVGLVSLCGVVGLQIAGVLSRNAAGLSMLAILGLLWLVMKATSDPSDDSSHD